MVVMSLCPKSNGVAFYLFFFSENISGSYGFLKISSRTIHSTKEIMFLCERCIVYFLMFLIKYKY
jgi:hypothetical protein